MICRFLPSRLKRYRNSLRDVSGPIFTKTAQNVAKIMPFITSKAKLRYSNPLRNVSELNKDHFAKVCPKSVALAT